MRLIGNISDYGKLYKQYCDLESCSQKGEACNEMCDHYSSILTYTKRKSLQM